jgi:hypothetical protein
LERLLNERYTHSVTPTLQALDAICRQTEAELATLSVELASNSVSDLRARVGTYVQVFSNSCGTSL